MKEIRLICAALALGLASTAWAASDSKATLTNFQFASTDLAPNDGIPPYFVWTAGFTGTTAYVTEGYGHWETSTGNVGYNVYIPAGTTASNAHAWASAKTTGFGVVSPSFTAEGQSFGDPGNADYRANASLVNGPWWYDGSSLTIAPFTSVTISAVASLEAHDTIGITDSSFEYAAAFAALQFQGAGSDGSGTQKSRQDLTISQTAPGLLTQTALLSVTFENLTSSPMVATFSAQAGVMGTANIAAVPEASGAAMLLLGLGGLAAMGRRRKAV